MSIVTCNRTIVPAVWPGELGRASSGAFDLQVRDTWQYVPETFEGVCDWATIANEEDTDTSWGRKHLIYRPAALPKEMRKEAQMVVVVLQGFLGDFNVTPLGNWDRDRSASSAIQYLTLKSGGATEPFAAQVRALRHLRDLASAKVGVELEDHPDSESTIFLQRPVFTKVHSSDDQPPAVRLGNVSDPGGRAQRMSSQWRVDHLIRTGARREKGVIMKIAPTSLHQGDFVEVTVFADVQLLRRKKRVGTVITFAMKDVVRLWTPEDARRHYERTDDTATSEVVEHVPKKLVMPSVFNIGADGEEDEGDMEVE